MNRLRKKLFSRALQNSNPGRQKSALAPRNTWRNTLSLKLLEDRTVPHATISIANASMNEIGNVSAFATAGSGGLSGPKDLVLAPTAMCTSPPKTPTA